MRWEYCYPMVVNEEYHEEDGHDYRGF
jgi:hypothetical protein